MKVEAAAFKGDSSKIKLETESYVIEKNNDLILDTGEIIFDLWKALKYGCNIKDVCAAAQDILAFGVAEMAIKLADKVKTDYVAVSGGVFANERIFSLIKHYVEHQGFKFVFNRLVPPGDGGLALGQCVVATAQTIC